MLISQTRFHEGDKDMLDVHPDLTQALSALAAGLNMPHMLFHGASGSGKRTRIRLFLRQLYGPDAERVRSVDHSFTTSSKKSVQITAVASKYHTELHPTDGGFHDRSIVQHVVRELAEASWISSDSKVPFRVLVLHQVDGLSAEAQQTLRRVMEKHAKTCRFILVCQCTSKLIPSLCSRCLAIRVPSPTQQQIKALLRCQTRATMLSDAELESIARESSANMQSALAKLDMALIRMRYDRGPTKRPTKKATRQEESVVKAITRILMYTQQPNNLLDYRELVYQALGMCINAQDLLQDIVDALLDVTDQRLAPVIIELAAKFDHRLSRGSKNIFHLEGFACAFMHEYQKWVRSIV